MYIDNCTFNTAGMNKLKKVSSEFMFCLYRSNITTGHMKMNKLYQFSQQEPVYSKKDLT